MLDGRIYLDTMLSYLLTISYDSFQYMSQCLNPPIRMDSKNIMERVIGIHDTFVSGIQKRRELYTEISWIQDTYIFFFCLCIVK